MNSPRIYTVHTKVSPDAQYSAQHWSGLTETEAAIKYVEAVARFPGNHNTINNDSGPLTDIEIEFVLATLIFRIHVPSRPAFMSPIFRGIGNLDNAQEALAEFKEDVPNLADQVRIEYQPIPEWTPLV